MAYSFTTSSHQTAGSDADYEGNEPTFFFVIQNHQLDILLGAGA